MNAFTAKAANAARAARYACSGRYAQPQRPLHASVVPVTSPPPARQAPARQPRRRRRTLATTSIFCGPSFSRHKITPWPARVGAGCPFVCDISRKCLNFCRISRRGDSRLSPVSLLNLTMICKKSCRVRQPLRGSANLKVGRIPLLQYPGLTDEALPT
jgi:hypothetical protein